jgi:hypothetical protein
MATVEPVVGSDAAVSGAAAFVEGVVVGVAFEAGNSAEERLAQPPNIKGNTHGNSTAKADARSVAAARRKVIC